VALGVTLGSQAEVALAGGFLIQALPGGEEAQLERIEERIRALPPVTDILARGGGAEALLGELFADIPHTVQARTDLAYRCTCNRRQVAQMLGTLGGQELRQLAAENEETVVTCEFCKEPYRFSSEELAELAAAAGE
jgi:molecular chaperone Hsp33